MHCIVLKLTVIIIRDYSSVIVDDHTWILWHRAWRTCICRKIVCTQDYKLLRIYVCYSCHIIMYIYIYIYCGYRLPEPKLEKLGVYPYIRTYVRTYYYCGQQCIAGWMTSKCPHWSKVRRTHVRIMLQFYCIIHQWTHESRCAACKDTYCVLTCWLCTLYWLSTHCLLRMLPSTTASPATAWPKVLVCNKEQVNSNHW